MFQLDLKSKKSIHQQIVDGFKTMIINGELMPDDKLPSVRDLSAKLTVNPNTIAKAVRSLETEGWIYTVSGRGCFVSERENGAPDMGKVEQLYSRLDETVRELLFMGITEKEIISKMEDMIKKGGDRK